MTVGEFDLIAKLRQRLGEPPAGVAVGPGDDAAVTTRGGTAVTSVDALVEGVHFRRAHAPPRSIGRKAMATALSDLAAMGAAPCEAYVVLGVPSDLDEDGCLEIFEGLREVGGEAGATILGGDITRAPVITLALTVVGAVSDAGAAVRRGGASAGEVVALTGELGGAAAGLALLERPDLGAAFGDEVAAALRARNLEPRAALAEGAALARSGATAMIDLSDGLGADASHVAAESDVRLEIELGRVRLEEGVAEVAAAMGREPLELAVSGGEDYELLACLPEEALAGAAAAVAAAGGALRAIGTVVPGEGVVLSLPDGRRLAPLGYDQLR